MRSKAEAAAAVPPRCMRVRGIFVIAGLGLAVFGWASQPSEAQSDAGSRCRADVDRMVAEGRIPESRRSLETTACVTASLMCVLNPGSAMAFAQSPDAQQRYVNKCFEQVERQSGIEPESDEATGKPDAEPAAGAGDADLIRCYAAGPAENFSRCSKVIELSTATPHVRALAYARRALGWFENDSSDHLQKTMADADAAIRLDSNVAEAYLAKGSVYMREASFRPAIDAFGRALALGLGADWQPFAYEGRAMSRQAWGRSTGDNSQFDLAMQDLEHAIKLTPENARLYRDRAFVERLRGESQMAQADEAKADQLAGHQ